MPKYTFCCNKCKNTEVKTLSISEYLKHKEEEQKCSECDAGVLSHQMGSFDRKVDRSSREIVDDIKEEVQATIKKIKAGDQRTIEDVYGHRPNPYKE